MRTEPRLSREGAAPPARPRWPGGKPTAFAVVVSVEYYDLYAPAGAYVPANVPGGFGRAPYPDYRAFSMREYGSRVGVFRLFDVLARCGFTASMAADAYTARHRPVIVRTALREGWEIVGHGLSGTHAISSRMTRAEEWRYIAESLEPLAQLRGAAIQGWHGVEYGQSARTPSLLARCGVRYMLDWPLDERPVPMRRGRRSVLALPMSADFDDVMAHWHRKIGMGRWARAVDDALQRLVADGRDSANLLILNLHPWLMGQPFRTTYLAEVLQRVRQDPDIWLATTGEIARWHDEQRVGEQSLDGQRSSNGGGAAAGGPSERAVP